MRASSHETSREIDEFRVHSSMLLDIFVISSENFQLGIFVLAAYILGWKSSISRGTKMDFSNLLLKM